MGNRINSMDKMDKMAADAKAEASRLEQELQDIRRAVAEEFWRAVVVPLMEGHGLRWAEHRFCADMKDESAPAGISRVTLSIDDSLRSDLRELRVQRSRCRPSASHMSDRYEYYLDPRERLDGTEFFRREVLDVVFRVLQFAADTEVGGRTVSAQVREMRRRGELLYMWELV